MSEISVKVAKEATVSNEATVGGVQVVTLKRACQDQEIRGSVRHAGGWGTDQLQVASGSWPPASRPPADSWSYARSGGRAEGVRHPEARQGG